MKERQSMLRLKAEVITVKENGHTGISHMGKTIIARNTLQETILQRLLYGEQPLDELKIQLGVQSNVTADDPQIALALAGFILDFSDYIENTT